MPAPLIPLVAGAAATEGLVATGVAAARTAGIMGTLRTMVAGAEGGFGKLVSQLLSAKSATDVLDIASKHLLDALKLLGDGVKRLVDFVVKATLAYAEFDAKLDAVRASSGSSAGEMAVLGDRARELASALGFDVTQVIEGLKGLADAGMNAGEQMRALGPSLQLSQVTGQSVSESVGLMAKTLDKFQMGAGRAGEVADTFAAALRQTTLSAPDLATVMDKLSENAALSGQSLQGSIASVSTLKDMFGDTATAATSFDGMLKALQEKSGELGVQVTDSSGRLLPMIDILRNMEKAGFDAAKAGEKLGKDAGPTLAILLSKGSDELARLQGELRGTGLGAQAAKEATDNLGTDMKKLGAATQGIMQSIGAFFEPIARETVQLVTRIAEAVREFIEDHSEVGTFIAGIYSGAIGLIRGLFEWFMKLPEPVKRFIAGLNLITAPIVVLHDGLKALEAIGAAVYAGWNLLVVAGYDTFGQLTKYITDNVAKALGAIKDLLNWVAQISTMPGVSKIPGLSDLAGAVGKQAGQWAASVGQLQGKVQNIGKELETAFHGKAEQALESYIRNTTLATQATSAFQQSLKSKKAAAEAMAAALAAAGKGAKEEAEKCSCDQGTNVGITVNQLRPPEPPSFHKEIAAAFEAAQRNADAVKAAFASLNSAPVKEIAQKYGVFEDAVQKATKELEGQRDALRKLAPEHPGVARAIAELDKALEAIGRQREAAEPLKEIVGGFEAIAAATVTAQAALASLDSASLSDLLDRTDAVDRAMAELDKTIADQQARLAGLTAGTDQYKSIQEELRKALGKRVELEAQHSALIGKVSEGTRAALEAIQGYSTAESAAFKVQKLAEYLAAIEKIKTEINNAGTVLRQLEPGSDAARDTEAYIKSLEGQLAEVQKIAAGKGIKVLEPADDPLKEYADIWDKFVSDATSSFSDLFLNVLEGNVDSFEDFVDNIKKLFKKMLADMVAAALKKVINIPVAVGGEGVGTGAPAVPGGGTGSFNLSVFNNPDTKEFDLSRFLGTAAMGYGIGSMVGSFAAQEDNYAEVGAQVLGVVGAIVGAIVLSWLGPQVGAMIGSVVGSAIGAVLGSLIKKGLPRTTATLAVDEGRAVVDEFYTRNKGSLDQIRQYAEGVVKGINDLAALTGGILLDLPNVKLSIKNNKFFQVVDSSGITHKFGEDYEAAINYAVLLALKEARFSGLSPEVEAAIRNSKATTIEELASDIEFAKEVQDVNLDPVAKDLRDVIHRFNEMSARARELGISLDKVDTAFSKAVNKIKEDILSGLKPFQEAGLTDVEREARRISEAFEEMRESARQFNDELALETQSRNDEIGRLQEELVRQQELLAQAQQNPEDFLPPELLEHFAAMGRDVPEWALRGATSGIQEMIDQILAEIARLQGLNASQTPIDMSEIDEAEQTARRALRERVRDSLEPYMRLDLTQVQQQLRQLDDTFEKLRRDAQAAGVSVEEVDQAYAKAREAIRKQVMDQLQPYLDLAAGMTPLQVALRDLDKMFTDLRTNAAELGIDPALVDTAEQAAHTQLRKQFEDELAAFAGQNPFVAQLDELKDKFEELTLNAIALGLGTEQVNEAYGQALETMQRQFQDGIQSYLDYGRGLSDLAVRHRDLTRFFDEQREAALALDEALGFTGGGGPNEQLLGEAESAAFQQLVDDFKASLQDLRDAGLTPTEIAVRDMRDRFSQLREDAALLGLSVDELTRLEVEAIDRLRGELDAQLDRYLLSDEEQQQRSFDQEFLGYLRDAFALYTYEPGMDEPMEPEPFPGANELELAFTDVKTAAEELEHAFRLLRSTVQPDGTTPPMDEPPTPGAGPTPGEIVASVLDFLEPLREGRGMDDLPADQRQAIDAASTQVSLLLEQLRLGMTDDVGALQGALGNLVGLLEQSGVEIDGSLLTLVDALAAGDISGFLDDLRNGVIGSTDGFGALIDILLSGDVSLPDLMHQLASGTFDAIKAMLGLTELPEDLAAALQRIGKAYESGQRQQVSRRSVSSRGSEAAREVDQRERERDALLKQLEQFESLALSPTEREIRKLNEQFDEMRANAGRLGISLDRVEAAYQLAIEEQRKRVLSQLEPYEDLALSPAERELKALNKQFDELRASAALLNIPLERVEAAYQLALEDRRKQERDALVSQLEPYEDLALSPLERELKALDKQFDEMSASAERLGIPLERVEAAYELALQQKRDALIDQLKPYEDLALSPVERELQQLSEQFDQMRADAQLLGISLDRVEAAYQLALEQQRKALLDQIAPYEEGALSPAERELQQLNEQFEEMRANALLLGVSLDRVEAAYQQAIADFWERLLGPLQEFRDSLALSELSTLTPEQRLAEAQARFDDLTARALGGDMEAAQQLQGAAQQLLQEAQSFYASGEGYQNLFSLVTGTIDQILASLPGMFGQPQTSQAAEGFDALLAEAGWGYQDSLAARGIPFSAYPGDTYGEPVELPFLTGITAEGKPALAVDLTGVREDNMALREELRLNRQQEHVDAVELQKRVDQQSEELREVRALLRRLTSNTQYGGRA